MISEGRTDGRVIKMMSNCFGFGNKSCQKWLTEQRLFGLENRRPRKDMINGLKIFEGLSCRPRISRQGNEFQIII